MSASDTAVIFCCDRQGLPYAAFAATQIAARHPERTFDILIAGPEGHDLPDWLRTQNVQAVMVPPPPAIATTIAAGAGFLSPAAYLRLWLPEALEGRYLRLLYLDIDVYPRTSNLGRLLAMDLRGHAFAAVRDLAQWRALDTPAFELKANGFGGLPYFNSGVMLMDLPRWRAARLTERCLAVAESRPVTYTHDQGLLNLAELGHWAELHPTWNWHMTRDNHALISLMRPQVLHFAGRQKPWGAAEDQMRFQPWVVRDYAAFLEARFPAQRIDVAARLRGLHSVHTTLDAISTQWRMRAYLRRFRSIFEPVLPVEGAARRSV